ncbi:MAG: hypothetical protein QOF48_2090 [Verrucomicrobiota bacterium]|jgi:hypothetical protein
MNDNAKEIDALDCKVNPRHFERLFRYLVATRGGHPRLFPHLAAELVFFPERF